MQTPSEESRGGPYYCLGATSPEGACEWHEVKSGQKEVASHCPPRPAAEKGRSPQGCLSQSRKRECEGMSCQPAYFTCSYAEEEDCRGIWADTPTDMDCSQCASWGAPGTAMYRMCYDANCRGGN